MAGRRRRYSKRRRTRPAVGRCPRPDRPGPIGNRERFVDVGPAVRELDPVERVREARRASDVPNRLRQPAVGHAVSRRHRPAGTHQRRRRSWPRRGRRRKGAAAC